MSQKQKTILVSIAALLLWGYVFQEFFNGEPQDTGQEPLSNASGRVYTVAELNQITEKTLALKAEVEKYRPVAADPFGGYNIIQLSRKNLDKQEDTVKEKPQTRLRLLGIIWDEENPYALVAHANGRTYDVRKGSVVEGETILSIDKESIRVKVDSTIFELSSSGYRIP